MWWMVHIWLETSLDWLTGLTDSIHSLNHRIASFIAMIVWRPVCHLKQCWPSVAVCAGQEERYVEGLICHGGHLKRLPQKNLSCVREPVEKTCYRAFYCTKQFGHLVQQTANHPASSIVCIKTISRFTEVYHHIPSTQSSQLFRFILLVSN